MRRSRHSIPGLRGDDQRQVVWMVIAGRSRACLGFGEYDRLRRRHGRRI